MTRRSGGLRIAYITGVYPRATDTFIQREVSALRRAGIEVHTFSIRRPGTEHGVDPDQQAELDSTTYVLPASPFRLATAVGTTWIRSPRRAAATTRLAWRTHVAGVRGTLWQAAYFAEACVVARQLRKRRVRHLHNHFPDSSGTVAMLAAGLAGITFSFTMHGAEILRDTRRWRLDEKVARALFVCCVSWYGRGQAMLESAPEAWPRLHVVHCGVDLGRSLVRVHQSGSAHVVFVGRLDDIKGVPLLLEAIARLFPANPALRLTLVGDGPSRERLQTAARELGIHEVVTFAGLCSQDQVRGLLATADIFVLPSFFEGIPVSLMEAMACGVPVVSSNLPGINELVDEGQSGYLIRTGDVAQLAERIAELLCSPELRTRMGTAGRAKVAAEFDIDDEAARMHTLLVGALEGRTASARPVIADGGHGD